MPGRQQPLAPVRLRAAAAHGADVRRLGGQRERQRGVVQLGVVRQDGDVGGAVDAAELLEGLLRPCGDHLVGVREALAGGELGARVARRRSASRTCAARRAERRGVVDGAEDHEPRLRGGDVDEQRRPAGRRAAPSARPTSAPRPSTRARASSSGSPSEPSVDAVVAHQQLRIRASAPSSDAIRVTIAARPSSPAMRANSSNGLLPAHGSDTARRRRRSRRRRAGRRPRPPSRRCRSGAAAARRRSSTSPATSTTAPSTHPPETMPETSPVSLIAIFAPGGRGAERFTPTTVAIATRSPFLVQPARLRARPSCASSPPSMSSASSASDASEFPARNASTCGSAACMPRVSGSYSGCAFSGFNQISLCAQRAKPGDLVGAARRARRGPSRRRAGPRSRRGRRRLPCSRLSVASASPMRVPPDQSVAAAARARQGAVGVASAQLVGDAREPGAEHECLDAAAGGHARLHVLEQHPRVGLHRSGHVADEHHRPRALVGLAPVALQRLAAVAQRGAQRAPQVGPRRVRAASRGAAPGAYAGWACAGRARPAGPSRGGRPRRSASE